MTKEELIEALHKCRDTMDKEGGHIEADGLLLDYIDDDDIADAFYDISKWYA